MRVEEPEKDVSSMWLLARRLCNSYFPMLRSAAFIEVSLSKECVILKLLAALPLCARRLSLL